MKLLAVLLWSASAVAATAPAPPASTANPAKILPWGGAIAEPKKEPYKGPYVATLGCAEGLKNFPFLKPWVSKLEDFIAPVQIGSTEGSLFYSIGATTVSKTAVDLWINDSFRAPVDWKGKGGSIETAWLGRFPGRGPVVTPGPGYATVQGQRRSEEWSQMTSRHDMRVGEQEPAIVGYAANAIKDAKGGIGHTGGPSSSQAWDRFWSLLLSPAEIELLDTCTEADCKIKFSTPEVKAVTGASHQYRIGQFARVIEKRIDDYGKRGSVWAYEGMTKPMDWEDLPIGPEFPAKYATHFWEPASRNVFGYDVLDAEPGHQKPVVGLFSRQCEKRGTGAATFTACTDIFVYNNHYFDYWARLVFFFPWCDVQVALAYETLDIDQIKESRVVRVLFGGEIRKLMELLLETRLKRLHMLGF